MPDLTVTRTSAEIYARAQGADDFFGFAQDVLLSYCDYETVKPLLNDGVTAERYAETAPARDAIGEAARSYYEFALTKIEGERGISAERSVIKLREYAWLMGRDDVVAAMDAAPYPQYGAPKVAAFGEGFGFTAPGCETCGGPIPAGRKAYCKPGCALADKDHGSDTEPEGDAQ